MMLLACVGGSETMHSHIPLGKALTCLNSILACEKSFLKVFLQERNMLFVDRPVK